MLQRNLETGGQHSSSWNDLSEGAATILGFANLCSLAIANLKDITVDDVFLADPLSDEAKAILAVAATRGTIDIRANRDSFDSADRFLAVCVEQELNQRLLFLKKEDPVQTIRFLDGFRELCQNGLVIHHLNKDFSLSSRGFEMARRFSQSDFASLIEFATALEH
jgi:hypothetical protein